MTTNNNLEIGTGTEKDIISILRKYKYWAYRTSLKPNGQPVDIICAKSDIIWLIDAKHVSANKVSFTFDRIEPNQITSMMYARNFASIKRLGFAIFFERTEEYYWLSYDKLLEYMKLDKKSVNMNELIKFEDELQKYET